MRKGNFKSPRRVSVTALIAWPTSMLEMEERSPIRWQHRLKREHPTGTERRIAHGECGWKGGGSSGGRVLESTPTGSQSEGFLSSRRNGRRAVLAVKGSLAPQRTRP